MTLTSRNLVGSYLVIESYDVRSEVEVSGGQRARAECPGAGRNSMFSHKKPVSQPGNKHPQVCKEFPKGILF